MVIFAFTNAFMVLLSRKDDSYFQEKFSGTINQSDSIDLSDTSSRNSFRDPFDSFSKLWFCVLGVWNPIKDEDAGDDYMIIVLSILFSFITILIFFNLIMYYQIIVNDI
jgi:hypothetical protein